MEKIITTIGTQLLSKLSKDRKYYTQKNLSDYGFPQFLIKRITFHLVNELRGEFTLPGEEWLNRESDELLAEWAELQRTIKREIHLPAYLAEEIIKKSVKECVGMTIQPRKVIPELLFEDRNEMDSNQLTEYSSAITVNRFLVWSMIRYMEKKNRESLNLTDAARILESIESKIVENYHPLNWLSLVKPLYELSGSTVHSDLFRRFFEHKGKNHIAKEFDLIDDEIKESRFIEILSSPNSIHVEGYKDDQQTLFQEEDEGGAVGAEESNKDRIEKQDEMIEDLSDDTPIFQTFREESVADSDEWEEDIEGDLVLESEEDDKEDIEEEVVLESEEDDKEDIEEEPVLESEEDEEEDIEEEPVLESEEDEEENIEEEPVLESDEDEEEDIEEEPVLESEEDDEENDDDKNLTKEDQSELKDEIEVKHVSGTEEDNELVDIQDEELRAPWEEEEEEEEDSFTFIRHDHEEEDSSEFEPKELDKEEGAADEDDQEEVIEEEKEISKKEEPVSDAALLEIDDEEDEEDSSLLNRFMFDDTDTEETLGKMGSERNKKVTTIYDELNLVRNDARPESMDLFGTLNTPDIKKKTSKFKSDDKSSDFEKKESDNIRKFSDLKESESEKDLNDTEVPMWRSFLERDENDAKSAFQFDDESEGNEGGMEIEDSDEKLDEDGFIEEPIYDFTKREVDLDDKIGDLSNWMKDVRETFIEDLFGNSEDAYEQALSDIMEFDDWKNASKYIEKEIFTRNRIDVYDEIAVDFTDRLHSYFIENKS